MRKILFKGLGLLMVSAAPMAVVVSCSKKNASDTNTNPDSNLFTNTIDDKKMDLGFFMKMMNKADKNSVNTKLLSGIENKLISFLYEKEQTASVKFAKMRKKVHDDYSNVTTFDELPTVSSLEKDADNALKDQKLQIKNQYGIHNWEAPWNAYLRTHYGGALNESQAIDYIVRGKMTIDALTRFTLQIDSSTFIKHDFFKEGKSPKRETFITDNEYGLKFEDVLVKPNSKNVYNEEDSVYVYETKSFSADARKGKVLKDLFVNNNHVIIPVHYLLPVVPGAEEDSAWVATKKANLQDIVKKLLHVNDTVWPINPTYVTSGFQSMINFKGLTYDKILKEFTIADNDSLALAQGPDGNASKTNGGALGVFGGVSLLTQMAPGFSISALTDVLKPKAEVSKHIHIEQKNPLAGLQEKLWKAVLKLNGSGGTPAKFPIAPKESHKPDKGHEFNLKLDKIIGKLDKVKFAETVGNIFKDAFAKRALIYQYEGAKSGKKNLAVSQFGIHIMNNLSKKITGDTSDLGFVNRMIRDDLLQTSKGKSTRMGVESKISSFINQTKIGNISLYMINEYLSNDKLGFIKYLKEQHNTTSLDPKTTQPYTNPPKYTQADINATIAYSSNLINSAIDMLSASISWKEDSFVYGLLNKYIIGTGQSGYWNDETVKWLQKALKDAQKVAPTPIEEKPKGGK